MGKTFSGVLIGMLITSACAGLRQDFYGLEKYKAIVEATWVSSAWSIPVQLGQLGAAIVWLFLCIRDESRDGN